MPSLFPGFEYDIFISYRQKDNKGDRWITEFVNSLKTELESTLKEDVSIYFDENPHDGLLETHDVDDSLKEKLKCLILIPIVSQTYCDPKSFAWNSEFLAFKKIASEDRFGLKVRLTYGNVASRILPLRIHDLDQNDCTILENELGGKVRSVDFIYKSAGVNRPLTPGDNPDKNLNKTFYRDQINKTANAIKEIINGMVARENPDASPMPQSAKLFSKEVNTSKRSLGIGASVLLAVLVASGGYYWINYLQHKSTISAIRYGSIAILPFENNTGLENLNKVGQIATDLISTQLIQNRFWKVLPTQDVFKQTAVYSGFVTNEEAKERILKQSNVDYLIMGHYNLVDDSILLVASVNDVEENKILYTTPIIKCSVNNPMKGVKDAQQFILGFLMFSKGQRERADTRPPKYDAYKEFLQGIEQWTDRGPEPGNIWLLDPELERHFARAISLDADFLPPYFQLIELYSSVRRFDKCDSLLQILATKQPLFLEGDSLKFTKQRLVTSGDWDGLEQFLLSKVERGNSNFRPYFELAQNALFRQNKPRQALAYIAQCNLKEFDFENKLSDQWLYYVQVFAFLKLRQFEDIVKLTDSFPFKIKSDGIRVARLEALFLLNQKEKVVKEISPHQMMSIFRLAQLHGDTTMMKFCYDQSRLSFNKFIPETKRRLQFGFSVMMFRMGNTEEAEANLKESATLADRQRRIHMLGLLYAATGRKEKAGEIVDDLLQHENEFDHGVTRYYAAKIESELNDKEKSIDFLRQAVAKGFEFRQDLFEFDGDLKNMMNYPPFVELVTPKE